MFLVSALGGQGAEVAGSLVLGAELDQVTGLL